MLTRPKNKRNLGTYYRVRAHRLSKKDVITEQDIKDIKIDPSGSAEDIKKHFAESHYKTHQKN